jgi:hypothetical protein
MVLLQQQHDLMHARDMLYGQKGRGLHGKVTEELSVLCRMCW